MRQTLIILLLFTTAFAVDKLPPSLFFVANEGQWEEPFAFKASVGNVLYYITPQGMTLDIREYEKQVSPLGTRGDGRGVSSSAEVGLPTHPESFRGESGDSPPRTTVRAHVLKINYLNANPHPEIIGEDKLSSYSNYFLGRDSCKWRSFVGHYQTVRMKDIWPGIDVVQKIQAEGVETLYRVAAGANAQQINVQIEGLTAPLRTDGQGNLILSSSLGEIKEKAPFAYQIINHRQVEVPVRFQVLANNQYGLSFEAFDVSKELVIDPLVYGTFLGGTGPDETHAIAIDHQGRKVVVGSTEASDFPITAGAYQTHLSQPITQDGFVTSFAATGNSLVFSTYLGARGGTTGIKAASSSSDGAIYAAGETDSPNWPLSANAFDTVNENGNEDGVLVRLSSDGTTLEFSTYIGGGGHDIVYDLALDENEQVYLCGETVGRGFPITADALFPVTGGGSAGFISVFNPTNSVLSYSTYIPGNRITNAHNLHVISSGLLWVGGYTTGTNLPVTPDAIQPNQGSTNFALDGFLSLWDLNANRLVYCTYLGGENQDDISGIESKDTNSVVLVGTTTSPNFPTTRTVFDTSLYGGQDAFVTILSRAEGIRASTYLGGNALDWGVSVFADSGEIVVVGSTTSPDFPITRGAYDTLLNGNGQPSDFEDLFMARLNTNLSQIEYGTFLGGGASDFTTETFFASADTVWIAGQTGSGDFPVTLGAFQTTNHGIGDGFLTCFVLPDSHSSVDTRSELLPTNPSLQIYPNPFNPSTTLSFTLPISSPAQVVVYDLLGRTVYAQDLGRMNAGEHHTLLDMSGLPSGTYMVRLNAGAQQMDKKIVLLK